MPTAYVLLKCIAKAAVKNVANVFTFGVGGDILMDAWDYWQTATKAEERAAQVEAVARLSAAELREQVAHIVREEAAALPSPQQAQVATYLGQVPAMIRRSLRRPSDPSGKTTVPGTVFRKPEDMAPLLPAGLPRFKAGDRPLAGVDWELVELLGVGGFGEVWKARHPLFDNVAPVALKFCLDPVAKERLLNHEAKIINQVMQQGKHEGIVPLLHTYNLLSGDPPCLAYEYIDGGDLAGLIQGRRGGGLAGPQAAQVIQRLAEIVGFAHGLKPAVVHRDLKPANVLVKPRPGGKLGLRITDFGIGGLAIQQAVAQSRRASKHGDFLTAAVRGSYTPLYGSPQQMRGENPDPRDDVYALGVIWHQLLTGDLTRGRPGGEAWKKRLAERGMTPALLTLLASCIEDHREDRPGNAGELAEKLRYVLRKSATPTDPSPFPTAIPLDALPAEAPKIPPPLPRPKRPPVLEEQTLHRIGLPGWLLAALLVILVVSGVGVGIFMRNWFSYSPSEGPNPEEKPGLMQQGNFHITPPSKPWQQDKALQLSMKVNLAYRRSGPSSIMALLFKDYQQRQPRDAELIDEALNKIHSYLTDVEYEIKPKGEQSKLAGQPAVLLEFQGEDPQHVQVSGECLTMTYRGIGYWYFTWGPLDDHDQLTGEWATLREHFTLGDQREGWSEAKPKWITVQGDRLPYKLEYAESLWDKQERDGYDSHADVVLLGYDPRDKESRRGDMAATVQVLALEKAKDLAEAVKLAKDAVLEIEKEKQSGTDQYTFPGAVLEVVSDKGLRNPDNDADVGGFRGHISKFEAKKSADHRKYVVLGVVREEEGVLAVMCECAWERRDYWEQEFTPLLDKLKPAKGK